MANFASVKKFGLLLEAEVAPSGQAKFQKRYKAATNQAVTPKNSTYYKSQPNKWGAELRIYFNDHGMALALQANGFHVEYRRAGYRVGEYRYRLNDSELWWTLVEDYGLRLGAN